MGNLPPEQRKLYQLNRYHQRMDWAKEYLGGVCVRCGGKDNLEIDHIDASTKEYNLSVIWSHRLEKFRKELDKCQLLCISCHDDKTTEERGHTKLYLVELICPQCGKMFTRKSNQLAIVKGNKSDFCSRSCNGKFHYAPVYPHASNVLKD